MVDKSHTLSVPTLPVIDLVTGRDDSVESDVTSRDIYGCQARWDFTHLLRMSVSRRKELCSLLVKLTPKTAPDLKDSDSFDLWSRVSDDPSWPDKLMNPEPETEE